MDIEVIRQNAMRAISPLKPARSDCGGIERIKTELDLPEYYLVYFLLVDLLGFENLGMGEKVAWTIPVELEDHILNVEYWKFGVGLFSINDQDVSGVANEVVRLVRSGVRTAQPYFDLRAEIAVADSELNVKNRSITLHERFQFLLTQYKAKHAESQTTYVDGPLGIRWPDYKRQQQAEWLAMSTIEAFFSWTEHIFIHIAILRGICTTGEGVASLARAGWDCKFKAAIDISETTSKKYYDQLMSIRNQVRNFVAHGAFGKDGEAFSFHSGTGAVPVLLPHRQGHHSYRFRNSLSLSRQNNEASEYEAIKLIEDFIQYIHSGTLAPAWIFLDSGLDSTLTTVELALYSEAMTSKSKMTELVIYLSRVADSYANMDFWI